MANKKVSPAALPSYMVAAPKKVRSPRSPKKLNVVEQVREAIKPKHRLASLLAFLLGSIVPVAIFLVKEEVKPGVALYEQLASYLVAGGLCFSAITVYSWGRQAFRISLKAVGFCLLIEGCMVCSQNWWLSFVALMYLVCINGIGTAVNLTLKADAVSR
jgi:hypothetical protein